MKQVVEVRGVRIGEGIPKICVPLTDAKLDDLIESVRKLDGHPVDLVEWRIDWFEGIRDPEQVKFATEKLREALAELPLLVTIRTEEEGGGVRLSPEEYFEINQILADTGLVDLLDIQVFYCGERAKAWIAALQRKGVRIVGSWHNYDETPEQEEMEERLHQIQDSGVDISKLAVMPHTREDVEKLMRATRNMRDHYADRPLITMSMSGLGVASRIAGEYYGADLTFGTVGKASAPGQVPVAELKPILMALHEKKKIVLIGFMGSGKTTVGTTLAVGLDCPIHDTDQMIEEQEGVTIKELFATKGEAYFRQRETEVLHELKEPEGLAVIATGGGLPMREENHAPMKDLGVVIFLKVSKESVMERLKGDDTRPLLAGSDPEKKVEELLQVRAPIYEKAADLIILTD